MGTQDAFALMTPGELQCGQGLRWTLGRQREADTVPKPGGQMDTHQETSSPQEETECISREFAVDSRRPQSAIWTENNKASILPWAWALMGKYRLPLQMAMETRLRHLLLLVIADARDACFHYEGPEFPIHSSQKALQSRESLSPAFVMPGRCRQGYHSLTPFNFQG